MFIQIMQGKCSREDEMRAALDRWRAECEPAAEGWLGGTYGFTDDGMFVGVIRFASEEAAMRNSARPEQGRWWADTERLFDGPVEFHDCRDVTVMLEGGSDDAGFVQVIRGKVDDPQQGRSMIEQTSGTLHEARPEIVGATFAVEDDGTFTETVAFTDEATARANESKEMPPEMGNWEEQATMHDVRYMDLHHPFFATHGQGGAGR
jgi:hypothetical protein